MSAARRGLLLKTRLGLGALALGLSALMTAAALWLGMQNVASRLDAALASEARMARYAALSTQASTFLVIATEAVQTGQPAEARAARLAGVEARISATFAQLRADVEEAVKAAADYGLNEQSRYGSQSLSLARMEALFEATLRGLGGGDENRARLRAWLDSFSSGFDPLLGEAVNTERLFRDGILAGIHDMRQRLSEAALGFAGFAALSTIWFYAGLVRPQFKRLDRLREAAARIGRAEFDEALPTASGDEIGALYHETNRMAAALKARQEDVAAQWARLNEIIDQRTAELSAANETLAKIDENRRRFFADISHELRSPLTVISLEAQIGRRDGGAAQEALRTIEASAGKLSQRIDDLLRVARSESGELALEPRPTPLPALMKTVEADIIAEMNSANMSLRMGDSPDCSLLCDPDWIRQVLISLLRNAIRHARAGGVAALEAKVAGDMVIISLTDNGPGVPAPAQEAVFERFVQGGGANSQGFGVGLALARWVIESHGGKITLTSPVPREKAAGAAPGAIISLYLPRAGS